MATLVERRSAVAHGFRQRHEQIALRDLATRAREDNAALDRVFQFTHVAGPRIGTQRCYCAISEAQHALAVPHAVLRDKSFDKTWNIIGPLAQWRDRNRINIEP